MATNKLKNKPSFESFTRLLKIKRNQLVARLYARRSEISSRNEGKDQGDLALQSIIRDLGAASMEAEIRTLAEVELALRKIQSGKFGLCGSCGQEIHLARLKAIPWTHLCIGCAGGGIKTFVGCGLQKLSMHFPEA